MAQIILGIPGMWKNRSELVQTIASKSEGWLLAGSTLHHAEKECSFQVEIADYEPDLQEAYYHASRGMLPNTILDHIKQHTFTVYVIAEVNDLQGMEGAVNAGAALFQAGGLAVKIETSGLAYSKEEWYSLNEELNHFSVYSYFVNLVGDEESYYSSGMQVFGLPDVIVPSSLSPEAAADLLNNFNVYHLDENPSLQNGDKFSQGEPATEYTLSFIEDVRYEEDDPFFNPYGLIVLER